MLPGLTSGRPHKARAIRPSESCSGLATLERVITCLMRPKPSHIQRCRLPRTALGSMTGITFAKSSVYGPVRWSDRISSDVNSPRSAGTAILTELM